MTPVVAYGPREHAASFTKDPEAPASRRKPGPGRPPGLINKLTREMQDAVLAAAEELGRVPPSKWEQQLEEIDGVEDGMKQFYKVLAVRELKTFGLILARMMPKFVHRTTTKKNVPTLLTEEQVPAPKPTASWRDENGLEATAWSGRAAPPMPAPTARRPRSLPGVPSAA